jgi:hypothetical protein
MSPEEIELKQRIDEMTPHQRALRAVLSLWTTVTMPVSIALGIALAAVLARESPGSVNGGIFLAVYFVIAMPGAVGGALLQGWARRRLARRILADLNEGANDAVGGATSVGFLGSGDFREARDDVVPRAKPQPLGTRSAEKWPP